MDLKEIYQQAKSYLELDSTIEIPAEAGSVIGTDDPFDVISR